MKVKPYKQEVIELVLQFLAGQLGEKELAEQLRSRYIKDVPSSILQNNLLLKKGLTKIIKTYVQVDKNMKQYYMKRVVEKPEESEGQEEKKPKKIQVKKTRKVSEHSEQESEKIIKKPKTNLKLVPQATPQKTDLHHANTSTWVKNKFQPPKKLQQIGKDEPKNGKIIKPIKHPSMVAKQASSQQSSDRPLHSDHSQSEQKNKPTKKEKKVPKKVEIKNKKQKQSSSQQSSQQSSQPKKVVALKQKKVAKQQKKVDKQIEKQEQKVKKDKNEKKPQKPQKTQKIQKQEQPHRMRTRSQDIKQQIQNNNNNNNGYKKSNTAFSSFSRIKLDQVGPIPEMLKDNSFQAKFKYGKGGDEWGKYGHERLKDTRGDSFKKTKDKLKNKAYQGGKIDFNIINSIPIE